MYVCVRVLMCAIPRQCSPAGFLKSQNSSVTRPNMVVFSERSGARGNTYQNVQVPLFPDPFTLTFSNRLDVIQE